MNTRVSVITGVLAYLAFGVALLLSIYFSSPVVTSKVPFAELVIVEIAGAAQDRVTHWLILSGLAFYFFIITRLCWHRGSRRSWSFGNPGFWVVFLVATTLLNHILRYDGKTPDTNVLTILAGAVFGQTVFLWYRSNIERASQRIVHLINLIVGFLLAGAIIGYGMFLGYAYHGQDRWTGLWSNPNIFGLFMGVGLILSVGHFLWRGSSKTLLFRVRQMLYGLIACIFGYALLKSYSRGAWFGTALGITYLGWWLLKSYNPNHLRVTGQQRGLKVCSLMAAIIFFLGVVSFWNFKYSVQHPYIKRVFSLANKNDFSWRKRVLAYEGASRLIGEQPLMGHGWKKIDSLYASFFQPTIVDEGQAVNSNDYLLFAMVAGAPALLGLIGLLRASMRKTDFMLGENGSVAAKHTRHVEAWKHYSSTCKASLLVLAMGFWFDGALFKIPTASLFWTLLALGWASHLQQWPPDNGDGQKS